MTNTDLYPLGDHANQTAALLDVSKEDVLAHAGIDLDHLIQSDGHVTAEDYFKVWNAAAVASKREDFAVFLGKRFAHYPFVSAVFAYFSSPDVLTGLRRLRVFRSLIGPIDLIIESTSTATTITLGNARPEVPLPGSFTAFKLAYFIEMIRCSTAAQITPLSATLPPHATHTKGLDELLGVPVTTAEITTLTISSEDAARPLVSQNDELWTEYERVLRAKLEAQMGDHPFSSRVRSTLVKLLPAQRVGAEHVALELGLSQRTLQRRLSEEGSNFRQLLEQTRQEVAEHYLKRGDLTIDEISYLLAYDDPRSFYRAFQRWTGQTPSAARRGFRKPPEHEHA